MMPVLDFIGSSAKFRAVLQETDMLAPVHSTVLIPDETGIGKECLKNSPMIPDFVAPQGMTMAERELGAFISAVTELYGSEQASLSAEDWLDELMLVDKLPGSTAREWRLVTIAAAARLAKRCLGAETSRRSVKYH